MADFLLGQESTYWSWDISLESDDTFGTPDLELKSLRANLGLYYCDVKYINKFEGREIITVPNK